MTAAAVTETEAAEVEQMMMEVTAEAAAMMMAMDTWTDLGKGDPSWMRQRWSNRNGWVEKYG